MAEVVGTLTAEVRAVLLDLARRAVTRFVAGGDRIEPPGGIEPLAEPRGVFVTLRLAGELRGCIGTLGASAPLGRAIVDNAIAAASQDPRFAPVTMAELEAIEVEVSVLSLTELCQPEDVIPGEHGLIVAHRGRRGLLLPQVAREYGWDRERFLSETCRKAGLPADAWRHGAVIERFSAEVISES
jgi:AmmeMemoRadiSam system protein A